MNAKVASWASHAGRALRQGLVSARIAPFRSTKKASKFSQVVPDAGTQVLPSGDLKFSSESTVDTTTEEHASPSPCSSGSAEESSAVAYECGTDPLPSNSIIRDDVSYRLIDSECGDGGAADDFDEAPGDDLIRDDVSYQLIDSECGDGGAADDFDEVEVAGGRST